MLRDFRNFLLKENFVALALAVVLGGAVGKVVQAIVDDFIMPIVGAVTPGGEWQKATWDVGSVKFGVGDFASIVLGGNMVRVYGLQDIFQGRVTATASV